MPMLAAVVANVEDVHTRAMREILEESKRTRQPALYNGQTRTYTPFVDEPRNEQPDLDTPVQVIADDQFGRVMQLCQEMWDAAAVRDRSNMVAKATVMVDGMPLIEDAPVPFLLYLEKQLHELRVLAGQMPVRDPAERWGFDEDNGVYRTAPTKSHRTANVKKVLTLVPPTDKHPGQAQPYSEDEPVGTYHTTKFTSAWSLTARRDLVDRITRLIDAVKRARVQANQVEAAEWAPAAAIAGYLWPASAVHAPATPEIS